MTPHQTPPLEDHALRAQLQGRGLRCSKPRLLILAYFREQDKHVSAEAVYLNLKERGYRLSLSTVYLNLGVLRQAELIQEFPGSDGEALYDSNVDPHHHLICKRCKLVLDLPLFSVGEERAACLLKRRAQQVSGWQVDEPRLELLGLCPTCQVASG